MFSRTAAGYALQRSFPAGLIMLAIYAIPIAMLNTAVAPLLLDTAPREYLGRVMAVFMPVNQLASMLSVVRDITNGRGSNIFLFTDISALAAHGNPLTLPWITTSGTVRLDVPPRASMVR